MTRPDNDSGRDPTNLILGRDVSLMTKNTASYYRQRNNIIFPSNMILLFYFAKNSFNYLYFITYVCMYV